MLNGIEFRGVRRSVFKRMAERKQCQLCLLTFMESGIIHDDDRAVRQLGDQLAHCPSMKDLAVDIAVKQGNGKQLIRVECADDVGAAFGLPVVLTIAPLTAYSIPVAARHMLGKTAFIQINNGLASGFISPDLLLETGFGRLIRAGMLKGFFYH
jgi:hypothetical protein